MSEKQKQAPPSSLPSQKAAAAAEKIEKAVDSGAWSEWTAGPGGGEGEGGPSPVRLRVVDYARLKQLQREEQEELAEIERKASPQEGLTGAEMLHLMLELMAERWVGSYEGASGNAAFYSTFLFSTHGQSHDVLAGMRPWRAAPQSCSAACAETTCRCCSGAPPRACRGPWAA